MARSRPLSLLAPVAAIALLGFAVFGLLLVWRPAGGGLQVIASGAFLLMAVAADRIYVGIPWILRPAVVLIGALVLSSVTSAFLVGGEDYRAYISLWLAQMAGFALGVAIWPRVSPRGDGESPLALDRGRLDRLCWASWFVFLGCAMVFFASQGVPGLSSNIEQSRVDLASSGTGYFRLLAYMTGPASLLLYATRGRAAWPYVIGSMIVMIGLANRSPLLYLLLPLGCLVAIGSRRQFKSLRIVVVGVLLLAVVAAVGTYRIASQAEFRDYAEYHEPLANGDYLAVAGVSVVHYATIVPENAVLVRRLVDDGAVPLQWGKTYGTLFLAAMPGQQLSPDLLIKQASGKTFVGGGTPPTLGGEGYMNAGIIGVVLASFALMLLLQYWGVKLLRDGTWKNTPRQRVDAVIYGYLVTWAVLSQVSGLAGASTVPLAGFLLLVAARAYATNRKGIAT